MDLAPIRKKCTDFLKKYRYAALVLLIGIALMVLPSNKEDSKGELEVPVQEEPTQDSINEQLADILSKVDGAGNVQVLLSVQAGEETLYQTDDTVTVTGDSSSTEISTIILSNTDKAQTGLIRQVNPPIYLGAVVVCQGGGDPNVKLAITEAVSKVTGLGADRISVLKMK